MRFYQVRTLSTGASAERKWCQLKQQWALIRIPWIISKRRYSANIKLSFEYYQIIKIALQTTLLPFLQFGQIDQIYLSKNYGIWMCLCKKGAKRVWKNIDSTPLSGAIVLMSESLMALTSGNPGSKYNN